MTTNDVLEGLRALDEIHREDGDGGYALLAEVVKYARALSKEDRIKLSRELLHLVVSQDRTMWGVALEALVQEWNGEITSKLAGLLNNGQHSDEWDAHVLMALLRLQYQPIGLRANVHISRRVSARDLTVLPLLAALSNVDAQRCLDLSTPFLIDVISAGQIDRLMGYISSVVSHFLDVNPHLPALLTERIAECDADIGFRIAELMCEYLERPYVATRLGQSQADLLKKEIRTASMSSA